MPETNVVELTGTPPRGSSTRGGGCLALFGSIFIAAGAGIAFLVNRHPEGANIPLPYIYGIAGLFSIAGLAVSMGGVNAMLRRRRKDRLLRERPQEPWMADYPWDRKGERDRPFAKALNGLIGLFVFGLFLAPFNFLAYREANVVVFLVAGLLDLLLLASIGVWFYGLGRALKYGAAWIEYGRFPFFLGDAFEARLGCRGRLNRFEKVTVTLRFIRETQETRGKSSTTVRYQHWAETKTYLPQQLSMVPDLPVSFALPAGDYGTSLTGDSPRYWEIEMKGQAPGIDFASSFLVPVYARGPAA